MAVVVPSAYPHLVTGPCPCGHDAWTVPETRRQALALARHQDEIAHLLTVAAREPGRWLSVLRCTRCGRLWAGDFRSRRRTRTNGWRRPVTSTRGPTEGAGQLPGGGVASPASCAPGSSMTRQGSTGPVTSRPLYCQSTRGRWPLGSALFSITSITTVWSCPMCSG